MTKAKRAYVACVVMAIYLPVFPFMLLQMFGEWLSHTTEHYAHTWKWPERVVDFGERFARKRGVYL